MMRDLVKTQKAVQQTGPDNSKACAPLPSRATRTPTSVLRLQQMMGNQAGQRMMKDYSEDRQDCSIQSDSLPATRHFDGESLSTVAPVKLQPKLEINARGDIYEQEADRVADQMVRSRESKSIDSVPSIHRLSPDNNNRQAGHTLRASESSAAPESEPSQATETSVRSLDSGGRPLDMALRSFFEPRFGHSFDDVRVHTDSSAAASARDLKARAYTRGRQSCSRPVSMNRRASADNVCWPMN